MLSNVSGVGQRPGVGLLIVGQLIKISICYHPEVGPFGRAPGPLDLLDGMASALPDEGTGFLGISMA